MSEFDIKLYITIISNSIKLISFMKKYFPYILNQPEHWQDIIENSLKQASEYLNKKLSDPNESIRGDWYSENSITDNESFRILELTIKDIINSNDKEKSIYTAYFWAMLIEHIMLISIYRLLINILTLLNHYLTENYA